MKTVNFIRILSSILFLYLLTNGSPVLAQIGNQSVKDCWEQPESCANEAPASVKADEESETSGVGITAWDVLRMIGSLVLVLAILLLILKWIQKKGSPFQRQGGIQTLAGSSLSPKTSMQVVKVGDRVLLLGVGENVQLLGEWTDEQDVEKLLASLQTSEESVVPPIDQWMKRFSRIGKSLPKATGSQKDPTFQSKFEKELRELKKNRKRVTDALQQQKGDRTNDE
ncbi:flagellar biosynthetic protein FliO [Bacillus fonticola]|uniref:flagellar biosynthetic protein FliO n=1 Tax=Bacillus fonticola TaxID=2728853 RepID=UPI001475D43E|nr:flagellar biosynthetic protein FliO [Bacillus fonticola]